MPTPRIDQLVWMAITDSAFCEELLNGCRLELIAPLNLSDEEQQAVLAVEADTLETFAEALCQAFAYRPLEADYVIRNPSPHWYRDSRPPVLSGATRWETPCDPGGFRPHQ